ncbi:hypothetical protein Vadar_020681 [Vaccinium darrowii]|uniref:Uncharacterized protein n=1 Tax=Vaccinium darrowii TaxID=229202 RepID=A0ACB7XK41_9ERIC|nr:hypothetical protein Vadar_020681 [Vaccinium darrowii]
MLKIGIKVTVVSFVTVFPAISRMGSIRRTNLVYGFLRKLGSKYANDPFALSSAIFIMDWTMRIKGLMHVHEMQQEGFMMDSVTVTALLSAASNLRIWKLGSYMIDIINSSCLSAGIVSLGKQLHCFVIHNCLDNNFFVASALIDMYSKSGAISYAENVFSMSPERNSVTYTNMILGYGQHGFGEKALSLFYSMRESDIRPNTVSLVAILLACSYSGVIRLQQLPSSIMNSKQAVKDFTGLLVLDDFRYASLFHCRSMIFSAKYRMMSLHREEEQLANYSRPVTAKRSEMMLELNQRVKENSIFLGKLQRPDLSFSSLWHLISQRLNNASLMGQSNMNLTNISTSRHGVFHPMVSNMLRTLVLGVNPGGHSVTELLLSILTQFTMTKIYISALLSDPCAAVNCIKWSPTSFLKMGCGISRDHWCCICPIHLALVFLYPGKADILKLLEIESHIGSLNDLSFAILFSKLLAVAVGGDETIKAIPLIHFNKDGTLLAASSRSNEINQLLLSLQAYKSPSSNALLGSVPYIMSGGSKPNPLFTI